MTTYSDWAQRQLDIKSGDEMARRAVRDSDRAHAAVKTGDVGIVHGDGFDVYGTVLATGSNGLLVRYAPPQMEYRNVEFARNGSGYLDERDMVTFKFLGESPWEGDYLALACEKAVKSAEVDIKRRLEKLNTDLLRYGKMVYNVASADDDATLIWIDLDFIQP